MCVCVCVRGGHSLKITFKGWVIKYMKHFRGGSKKKVTDENNSFPPYKNNDWSLISSDIWHKYHE